MAEREGTQDITNNSRIRHNTYGADPSYAKVIYRADDPETVNAFQDYIETHYFRSEPGQALELQTRDNLGAYQNRVTVTGDVADSVIEVKPDGTNVVLQVEVNLVTSEQPFAVEYVQSTPGDALTLRTRDNVGVYQDRVVITGEVADSVINILPDGTNEVLSVQAGSIVIDEPILPDVADTEAIGSTDKEISDIYLGTGRLWLYTDQHESIRSNGTEIVVAVGGNDELILETVTLRPQVSEGLSLGSTDQEWEYLYLSKNLYLYTDQHESIRSDGTQIVIAVGNADRVKISNTALFPNAAGVTNLGTTDEEWQHAYISGSIYFGATQQVEIRHNAGYFDVSQDVNVANGKVYRVNGTQVVGAQQAAEADIADTTGVDEDGTARAKINALLAKLRTHGLIDT